jgi:hypothetical protein
VKTYSYKGPAGEVEIKDPLAVRLVESSWWLTLWTIGFMVWGAYYLYLAPPSVFMGEALSSGHRKLAADCAACHSPFLSVADESCAAANCHAAKARNTLHDGLRRTCVSCHPEHTGGALLPRGITQQDCATCHNQLAKDPKSRLYASADPPRINTFVSRKLFKHRSHQFPPFFRCWQCHCLGERTINIPTRDLFLMSSCLKCHEQKDCSVCHQYHDPRDAHPKLVSCIDAQFVPDLLFKTLSCEDYQGRPKAFKDIKVCETGGLLIDYGKESAPRPVTGDTAQ